MFDLGDGSSCAHITASSSRGVACTLLAAAQDHKPDYIIGWHSAGSVVS